MHYIKDKEEQEKIIGKVKEFYKYDYIDIKDLELYKKFKYITYMDEGLDYNFMKTIYKIIDFSTEDYLYIFDIDEKSRNRFYEEWNFYPSIAYTMEDLKNKPEGNLSTCFPDKSDVKDQGINICVMPSSFKWLFCINMYNELGCFLSNDKSLNIKFTKVIREYIGREVTYTKDYLIEELDKEKIMYYYMAKNEKEFEQLPIAKLEIIYIKRTNLGKKN